VTTLSGTRRALVCALATAACGVGLALPGSAAATDSPVYHHLGTWVDIYDSAVFSSPSSYCQRMKNREVHTLYVETANYANSPTINHRTGLGKLLQFCHNRGIKVVAWTLPGHYDTSDDKQKALAAIRFKSPRGDRFNGFALDIESTKVSSISTRNSRLLTLSRQIQNAANGKPLGAITFSPVFISGPWPNFPWTKLKHIYDVFLPMVYSSYHYNTESDVRQYTRRAVRILRRKTSDREPIHVVGGIANDMSGAETRGFMHGVNVMNVAGGSLYDYMTSSSSDWRQLRKIH
jgi:hypothetical protein